METQTEQETYKEYLKRIQEEQKKVSAMNRNYTKKKEVLKE